LRLASAQRKIRAFRRQLAEVRAGEFAYQDGKSVLDDIDAYFADLLDRIDALPKSVNARLANALCIQTNYDIHIYTILTGSVLRSTNVRNAFEVQDPLKRIAQDAVRPDVRLILSSEWDYTPSTYPMNADVLKSSVFVGMPAQESRFALPFAIAGHEIGHSAWSQHGIHARLLPAVTTAIERVASTIGTIDTFGADPEATKNDCLSNAMRQIEEIFCDTFGLGVFGESYLYAFDYLLAPGSWPRSLEYPSVLVRNQCLEMAANQLGIPFNSVLFSGWHDSRSLPPELRDLAEITDQAVTDCVPQIITVTRELLEKNNLFLPRDTKIEKILESFRCYRPYQDIATLPEILVAGWRRLRDQGGLGAAGDSEENETLNEIVLKSIEISEFLQLAA